MFWIYAANVAVVLVAAWAVWERRLTFRSRFDASISYGIVLFGIGAALDSPWPEVARASHPLTGKYYLLMTAGHICYLSGAALGIRAIYQRLLTDREIRSFMRYRISPLITIAAVVMLICMVASPITSTMPADHLYLVQPDGWLIGYWIAFLGTFFVLELISMYGANQLRADPRSGMATWLVLSQAVGSLAILAIGFGVLTGRDEIPRFLVWPFAYLGIVGGSIAAVVAWRHRAASLLDPLDD